MTPRLRALIIIAATIIWVANALLPLVSTYQSESGVGVGVLGLYGVALGLPELRKRGERDDGDDQTTSEDRHRER